MLQDSMEIATFGCKKVWGVVLHTHGYPSMLEMPQIKVCGIIPVLGVCLRWISMV